MFPVGFFGPRFFPPGYFAEAGADVAFPTPGYHTVTVAPLNYHTVTVEAASP